MNKEGIGPLIKNKEFSSDNLQKALRLALREYKKNPHDPEKNTLVQQAWWLNQMPKTGLTIGVPFCNWPKELIEKPFIGLNYEGQSTMMIYRPPEQKVIFSRILTKNYKEKEGFVTYGQIKNINNNYYGWLKVEMSPDAPNKKLTEEQAVNFLASQRRIGQNLEIYSIASLFYDALNGQPFDLKNSFVRLPKSHNNFGMLGVNFDRERQIVVRPFGILPNFSFWTLGIRSFQTLAMAKKQASISA